MKIPSKWGDDSILRDGLGPQVADANVFGDLDERGAVLRPERSGWRVEVHSEKGVFAVPFATFRAALDEARGYGGFAGVIDGDGNVGEAPAKFDETNFPELENLDYSTWESQGRLLAENGLPSKLTEAQYLQVRTPEFREWFGDWMANAPPNAGTVQLYRWEPGENSTALWAHGHPSFPATVSAGGRWFTPELDEASWYVSEGGGVVSQVQVTGDEFRRLKSQSVDDSHLEVFVPEQVAATAKPHIATSRIIDGATGEPMVVYHGTPSSTFSEFKGGSYFSPHHEWAKIYENVSASSMAKSGLPPEEAPGTFHAFLNIRRPFDTRIQAVRREFERSFKGQRGTGTELSDRTGLPDWTDGVDILEYVEDENRPYDGTILDEGGVPVDDGVRWKGLSYVNLKPNQVRLAQDSFAAERFAETALGGRLGTTPISQVGSRQLD